MHARLASPGPMANTGKGQPAGTSNAWKLTPKVRSSRGRSGAPPDVPEAEDGRRPRQATTPRKTALRKCAPILAAVSIALAIPATSTGLQVGVGDNSVKMFK